MVLAQPKKGIGDEEVFHFGAPEIEDIRIPIRLKPLPGIGMLVERRTIEVSEPVQIGREMPGHPVDDDPETRGVRAVNETRKALRWAEPARRGKHTDRLISPRTVEWVFRNRHHFYMRESESGNVRKEPVGDFIVGQVAIIGVALPRTKMHFVDR